MLKYLLDTWAGDNQFINITAGVCSSHEYRVSVSGLDGSARSFFMAGLAHYCRRPALVVTGDLARAEKTYAELHSIIPGQVKLLSARDLFVCTDAFSRSEEQQHSRLGFLEWLNSGPGGIYVAPAAALLSKCLPVDLWRGLVFGLEVGLACDRQELLDRLVQRGYERVTLTETAGHFSARGDIIDIYPPGRRQPVRIELFDDVVESVRNYDPVSQRSKEHLHKIKILPARELLVSESHRSAGEQKINRTLEQTLSRLRRRGEKETAARLKQQVSRHLEKLKHPEGLDYLSSYLPFFYGEGASLLDYLSADFLLLLEEPAAIADKTAVLQREFEDFISSAFIDGELLPPGNDLLWKAEDLFARTSCPLVGTSLFNETGGLYAPARAHVIESKSAPYYHGQWDVFKNDFRNWLSEGYGVYLLSESEERGRALLDLIGEQDISAEEDGGNAVSGKNIPGLQVIGGTMEEGFVLPGLQLAVLTERNLLPVRRKKRRLKQDGDNIRLSDYRELSTGDYVVHEQHGIGRYLGLNTLEVGGGKRDYLVLKYRGSDKLYIPIDQVELIQKYSGGEGPAPRLHSLGGGEWQRLKSRVNRKIEELASELLALYAARQAAGGYSYGPDHPWQQEFEAHFPYEETPDQVKAVEDVKADLEKKHPMDRLICGDVGYGKTEVAMRAAFKVVMEGKQVAVLVPTTVLAQQHFRTFSERFEGFPVRIAQLSRFVSAAGQKETIKDLAAGKTDIIIGTHRLLSGDVSFHDLGLLVIDEEQRFGVRQKEKMKQLRLEVDTLAMTATPIPRTLHLSLAGGRDFSVIDTPPEDRYPVQTYVLEYSENLVRDAVQRELSRGGQVFMVCNRVDRIDGFAEHIQSLFPDASVAVGHGQMPEAALARVMTDFQDGKYRILVSTTIIESGLDIPNVNTLIIYEADRFGLAQLYQIRGRVGRSSRLAYAYLTYRRDKIVSETARKRLKAIKEFTELGSGFKIALRDLEIRGAGNILGAEQHGFIASVGFDLYVKLLDRAVAELKNEKREEKISTRLELQINAYLPSAYITAQDQKVDIYQRIYSAPAPEEIDQIEEELVDRYGIPPEPVKNLLTAARLRLEASEAGIELISQQQSDLTIQFAGGCQFDPAPVAEQLPYSLNQIKVSSRRPFALKIRGAAAKPDLLADLASFIKALPGSRRGALSTGSSSQR